MSEQEDAERVAKKLVSAMVQFRRLKFFPEQNPCPEEKQIRHSEIMILFALREIGGKYPEGVSITDLSEHLRLKSPTVTPAVYNLEQEGLVERSTDLKDRRVIRIHITEQGNRVVEQHGRHFLSHVEGLVHYLGEEKSIMLANLLNETFEYAAKHANH